MPTKTLTYQYGFYRDDFNRVSICRDVVEHVLQTNTLQSTPDQIVVKASARKFANSIPATRNEFGSLEVNGETFAVHSRLDAYLRSEGLSKGKFYFTIQPKEANGN